MQKNVNRVTLLGKCYLKPELKETKNGGEFVTFSLTTSETWIDKKTQEEKTNTSLHRIVVFKKDLIEIAHSQITHDTLLFLEGELKTRKWVDSSNETKYCTEISINKMEHSLIILSQQKEQNNEINNIPEWHM